MDDAEIGDLSAHASDSTSKNKQGTEEKENEEDVTLKAEQQPARQDEIKGASKFPRKNNIFVYHFQKHGRNQGWLSKEESNEQTSDSRGNKKRKAKLVLKGARLQWTYDDIDDQRNEFVKKMLIILLCMLVATYAILKINMSWLKDKLSARWLWLYVCAGCWLSIVLIGFVVMRSKCSRLSPWNYVCVSLVVILQSFAFTAITAKIENDIISRVVLATIGCVAVCSAAASYYPKYDFLNNWLYLLNVACAIFFAGIVIVITMSNYKEHILDIALIHFFTQLNILMFTFVLQLILTGKSIRLTEEDHALGAFLLYICLIQLFVLLGFTESKPNVYISKPYNGNVVNGDYVARSNDVLTKKGRISSIYHIKHKQQTELNNYALNHHKSKFDEKQMQRSPHDKTKRKKLAFNLGAIAKAVQMKQKAG